MNRRGPIKISIAGGGASATLVLAHLAAHTNSKIIRDITIYDRAGLFAQGIAYKTKNSQHLLNVRAEYMSAFPDKPSHLVDWLKEKKYSYQASDFIPRMIYADYLKELWDGAIAHFQSQGCDITLKQQEFEKDNSDIIIMATGNSNPFSLAGAEMLSMQDGYFADPWSVDYKALTGNIIIIGTGLSMVDTVVGLHEAEFKGRITAISRHALLPQLHAKPHPYPPFFDKEFPKTALGLLREIRKHIRKAEDQNIPWQAVLDSFRNDVNKIWLSLDQRQKDIIKRFAGFWNVHRHRMAPHGHDIINSLKKSGKLEIVKDSIETIEPGLRVQGRKKLYEADYVINCLGYGPDKDFMFEPEKEKQGIFALGPVLAGYYFETTAMPEIRVQAQNIADKILKF